VRIRTIGAAAAAVLAVTGLAGCRNNIGTAAVIDGHRVTESDVNQYLTPDAQPIAEKQSDGSTVQVAPRSFVVAQLIEGQLAFKVMGAIPSVSNVTESQLDARLQNDLAGKTVTQVAESLGLHGFTESFYKIVLRTQEISIVLRGEASKGVDVRSAFDKIKFPVSVSPRYGRWNTKTLTFSAGATVPSYLDLERNPGGSA
jgi:hypothetical protein